MAGGALRLVKKIAEATAEIERGSDLKKENRDRRGKR